MLKGEEASRIQSARWQVIVKLPPVPYAAALLVLLAACFGCNVCPTKWERERVHNPFPQLKRVAVLPFFNQSGEPTLDTEMVAEKYYAALQAIPGFEVLPVGVAKTQWLLYAQQRGEPRSGAQFQELARFMGVEALVVGSVTDFDSYYPPQMAMTVHWYAANEGFHPIPAGYGLPWGTEHQKEIPRKITREAEFELARSQLATQTPVTISPPHGNGLVGHDAGADTNFEQLRLASGNNSSETSIPDATSVNGAEPAHTPAAVGNPGAVAHGGESAHGLANSIETALPSQWPDPTDLIPDPPSPFRPTAVVTHEPVLSQTRLYRGDDPDFTIRLARYVETGDDARPGSWQGYLKRSDDFVHFCCHLHIMEMLESRGGSDQSDLILRWPLSRY